MDTKDHPNSDSTFIYFLRLVIKNWKLLFGIYLVIGIVTVVTLLVLPKWYKSEATIVILEEQSSMLNSILSDFSALGMGIGGGAGVDTYMQYIHTSKLYDRLISEFDLMDVYGTTTREDTYEVIFDNIGVADNENNTFSISFAYKEDPVKSKEIVEFIFQELDQIALEVDQAQASNYRRYIEEYYVDTRNELRADEDSLASFQMQTGILDLTTQVQATIEGIAELEIQKVGLEIEREYLKETFKSNSKIEDLETQIQVINNKIGELGRQQSLAFLSVDDIPERGLDYLRLRRDIQVGSEVSEFLRLQYEQALLDERKINSNLYMVDPPQVPEKKFKPQRSKTLVIVMFFTVVLSLIGIRIKEYISENEDMLRKLAE